MEKEWTICEKERQTDLKHNKRVRNRLNYSGSIHKHIFYTLLYDELAISSSLLIGRKRTVNFRNQRLLRNLAADYLSNRPQVSMSYKLINHAVCWENTRRICRRVV